MYADTLNRALQQMLTSSGHNATGTFAGIAGPMYNVVAFGADLTGAVDSAAAITAAQAAAGTNGRIHFPAGTYKISSNFTVSAHIDVAPGAKLQPASGTTLMLNGAVLAGDHQIFDYTAGGTVLPGATCRVREGNAFWFGVKADGSTDDSAAMNHLADFCLGKLGLGTRNGFNNAQANRPILLPPGIISLQSASWNISGCVGLIVKGAGRLVTTISVDTANMIGMIADAVAYPHFENFIMRATQTQDVSHPFIDADYTGTYPTANGYLKPQQWTFSNIYMNGNLKAAIGLQFCRVGPGGVGSNAQGDTVHIPNCLFGQFTQAPIRLGTPTNVAGNVVDWHIYGGDFQGNLKYGVVESYGGTIYLHGPGMQNQAVAWGGVGQQFNIPYLDGSSTQLAARTFATHVGNYAQIDNLGCDVYMTQYSSRGAIENLRSESACLTRGGGIARVSNCETYAGMIQQWNAATAFVQGELVKTLVGSVSLDGRAWEVFTATPTPGSLTTSGSEPAWASARDGFMQENVAVTSGSPTINCSAPIRVVNKGTLPGIGGNEWGATVIDPTGVNQKFHAKVLSHVQNTSVTLDANVPWTGNAIIRMGELVTDGSLQWMPYDFISLEGEFEHIDGGQFECGQLSMKVAPPQSITSRFSRRDWLYDPWTNVPPFNGAALISFPAEWRPLIGPGTSQFSWPQTKHSLVDPALQIRTYQLKGARYSLAPFIFPRATGTTPNGEVGVGAADGAYTLAGTRTDLTRNALTVIGGALAPDPVGFPDSVASPPANTAGKDIVINGGTSTGAAKSGRVVFATNPGGSAGSSVNDNVESAAVDGDATAGNTRFLLYDVTKATLSRVSVGAADSGGTGFKLLRVPN